MDYPILPEEVISLVCAELGFSKDFGTLYNCARSAKHVADSALRIMYQHHDLSPAFNYTDDDVRQKDGTYADSVIYFKSWANLWRSIICSSLEPTPTFKPYCRYLRILDFRNLKDMLESTQFRTAKKSFYAKPLAQFNHTQTSGKYEVPDIVASINHVGETIIPKSHLLEEISGQLSQGFLTRWVSQTPKLKRMVLWNGSALGSEAGSTIAKNCEHFAALSVLGWDHKEADDVFAKFLQDLKPDTIQYLQFISFSSIAQKSFTALGRHRGLKKLKLNNLCTAAMENLSSLKECTQIEVLSLEDNSGTVRLEELNNDVFLDVIAWLSSCKSLRDITIRRLFDGPSILAAVAIAPDVKWTKLCLEGYTVRNSSSAAFHTALTDQKELEELFLKGNGEDTIPQDLEIMVSAMAQLSKLKKLVLRQVSDEFDMTHISTLALSLPLLEEFSTSGQELSSDILPLLANLRNLRTLTLFALTQFDFESILDFVRLLDEKKQKGFGLFLMAVDQEFALNDEQHTLISESIRTQVGGSFGKSLTCRGDINLKSPFPTQSNHVLGCMLIDGFYRFCPLERS